jgi:hypothetical protein
VPPFGYLKDPDDHNHLIIDPETAPYIKKAFELCASGWGNWRIRNWFRDNKVPCPSKCVSLHAEYSEITELTAEILSALIRRIEVHESDVVDGVKRQRVDIYYRYAGVIDPCEYDALTFYQTKHVTSPRKKRQPREKEVSANA